MADQDFAGATDAWRAAFPEAVVGFMTIRQVSNPAHHPQLDARLADAETTLRSRYEGLSRADIRGTGHFPAYAAYYKRFGQNYHVLHQVESVALKGRSIPRRAALVESGFKNELTNQLLTAVHDLDALTLPAIVDVARGEETYESYNGETVTLKAGDMYIHDGVTVLSSIILGPSNHGRVMPETTAALFHVYAPAGIGEAAVRSHLADIAADASLLSSNPIVSEPVVFVGGQ